jgi:hypothetical protein
METAQKFQMGKNIPSFFVSLKLEAAFEIWTTI